jgi:hypothetical protein
MRRLHAGIAAVATAVLTAGLVAGTAAARHDDGGGHHGRTIAVIEHPDSDVTIDLAPTGDSAGDLLPFSNPIFDATNTTKVGDDQGNCVRTKVGVSYECNWTTNLKNGSITVEGAFLDAGPSTLAIIGGTGRYAGARGSMDLASTPDGKAYTFTFHLR